GIEVRRVWGEEWPAGSDLVGQRIAIVRRAALHDVGDEDLVTRPLDRREQLDELVAGPSHDRPPQAVLVEPRSLADEHDLGRGVAPPGTALVRVSWSRHPLQTRASPAVTSSAPWRSAFVS